MCKTKILVVAPEVEEGKKKVDYQKRTREKVQKEHGKDTKVVFFHCHSFEPDKNFFRHKINGAAHIVCAFNATSQTQIEGIPVRLDYSLT